MSKIKGYIYKEENILVIKLSEIIYIEYKNNSYSNLIPIPSEFKKAIVWLKNLNCYNKKRKLLSFTIDENNIFLNPDIKLNKLAIGKLLIRFENEENYNFHSLDLSDKLFNDLFKLNNIRTKIHFKKIGFKKLFYFSKIIEIEKEIHKNLKEILPVFLKNYINLKNKLVQNINFSENIFSIIKTIKNINIHLAFYNFLASKLIDVLREKDNKLYINKIIEIKEKINIETQDIDKKILINLKNKPLYKKLNSIAKNYFINKNKLLRDNPKATFPKIKIDFKKLKIKFTPLIYKGPIKASCVVVRNEDIIPKLTNKILVTKELNNFIIPILDKIKALIIERGAKKSKLTRLVKTKKLTLIQIPMATDIFKTGNLIEINKNHVRILK